ncbi:MAG: hypothetical protein ACNA8H_11130 [Anaerolineales bacterium]
MNKSKNHTQKKQQNNNSSGNRRSWPVTVLALLLAVQGIAMFILAIFNLFEIDRFLVFTPRDFFGDYPLAVKGVAFIGLSLLSLIACVGFFRLWSVAWMLAMTQQGLSLTLTIFLYFQDKPVYIYPIMVFCILIVIYLHYSDVITTFRTQPITEEWGGIDEEV